MSVISGNESISVDKRDFDDFLKSMSMTKEDFEEYTRSIAKTYAEKVDAVIHAVKDLQELYTSVNPFTSTIIDVSMVVSLYIMGDKAGQCIIGKPGAIKEQLVDLALRVAGTKFTKKTYKQEDNDGSED